MASKSPIGVRPYDLDVLLGMLVASPLHACRHWQLERGDCPRQTRADSQLAAVLLDIKGYLYGVERKVLEGRRGNPAKEDGGLPAVDPSLCGKGAESHGGLKHRVTEARNRRYALGNGYCAATVTSSSSHSLVRDLVQWIVDYECAFRCFTPS